MFKIQWRICTIATVSSEGLRNQKRRATMINYQMPFKTIFFKNCYSPVIVRFISGNSLWCEAAFRLIGAVCPQSNQNIAIEENVDQNTKKMSCEGHFKSSDRESIRHKSTDPWTIRALELCRILRQILFIFFLNSTILNARNINCWMTCSYTFFTVLHVTSLQEVNVLILNC